MKPRILVTGGAGYLGSVLVPELLAQGYPVTVVDNFLYGQQTALAAACTNPEFDIVNGDVRDPRVMRPLFAKADAIIPLAAIVGAPACERDPVGARTTNRDAVLEMLRELSRDQLVLMPTTNSAYGSGDASNFCDETSPLRPISAYARDKVEVERALLERENAVSFRLATVFGISPRMRLDLLVNDFAYRAATDRFIVLFEPRFKRNYIHVRDVARVFLHGLASFARMRGQIYNVGLSDANLSKLELCEAIRKHVPELNVIEAEVGRDPDQRNYIVSNAKIEATGWAPKYSLDFGIRELLKGYRMIRRDEHANA